jgi:predicted secreted acid phosphatase
VVVLWITALPAGDVSEVAEALKTSGLDPASTDPLLLVRSAADRKQVLREDAQRDVCVIAIAGDRKGDFDELFDYLRDPASGESLDYLLGAGWFILPPPLG